MPASENRLINGNTSAPVVTAAMAIVHRWETDGYVGDEEMLKLARALRGEQGLPIVDIDVPMPPVKPPKEDTKRMRLFIWNGFCSDYTDGLAFAISKNEKEARKQIIK